MSRSDQSNVRWIGLAEVRPTDGNNILKKGYAASVPIVGDATNPHAFWDLARQTLATLKLTLIKIDDLEQLSARRLRHRLSDDLERAVAELSTEMPLALGSFHAFKGE
jgi:hypothetical protein